jgi:predicted lysophospholipase L1 biosynthesis ABC-type transport system permease subunit
LHEPDRKQRAIRRYARRGVWLFVIVTLAVICGNLISAAIIAQFTDDARIEQIEATLAAEQKKNQQDKSKEFFAEEARKESSRLSNAVAAHERLMARAQDQSEQQLILENQLNALCDFWIVQHQKDQQASTKNQRDSACKEAGR